MPEQRTKKMIIKRAIVYLIMTICVVALSVALLFLMLGYRFNKLDGTFQQGGLVQFITQPSGAHVKVGTADLTSRTRSKITLNPGTYPVKMTLDGYIPWEKKVTVKGGEVLWLNSVLFIPSSPKTSAVATMKTLGSTTVVPEGKYFAYIEQPTLPTISFININDSKPTVKSITLPAKSYMEATTHSFQLVSMSDDEHHVLVQHTTETGTEWLVADLENAEKAIRLGGSTPQTVSQVIFSTRSNDEVFLLTNEGTVHTMKISDGALSGVLISNVKSMSLSAQGTLFYATIPKDGKASTGYLSYNADKTRLLKTYESTADIHVTSNQYYDEFYVTTSVGAVATATRYDAFPRSDDSAALRGNDQKTLTLALPIKYLSSYTSGRFLAMQTAQSQTVYDFELKEQSDTPIKGSSSLVHKLVWLDDYHFWSDATDTIRLYEFDGTNQTDITKAAQGFSVAYGASQKYLYSIGETDAGYQLQRTLLVLN